MKWLSKVFSTFFGAGYFPVAPGTFASLLAALLFKWALWRLDQWLYLALVVTIYLGGVCTAGIYAKALGRKTEKDRDR